MGVSVDDALPAAVGEIIERALKEDLNETGDITSGAVLSPSQWARAVIRAKEKGIVSGTYTLGPLYRRIDPAVEVTLEVDDACEVEPGRDVATVLGPVGSILAGERIGLNLVQHLSGIATRTATMVKAVAGTHARILDTRKTTPGMRLLEKRAVVDGGGVNHRFGLFDMILLKDTHVTACGGVVPALRKAAAARRGVPIEIEVGNRQQFESALALRPDRIMLDNMSLEEMRACVGIRNAEGGSTLLEASGAISEETVREVASTGVDYISAGCLTHSVRAVDIHLIIETTGSESRIRPGAPEIEPAS